jgi:hypothetical protein
MNFELFGKKKEEPPVVAPVVNDVIATVVFAEREGRICYEFKNKDGKNLQFNDVNPRFLFPLITAIEKLFWVDPPTYANLSEQDYQKWYLTGMKNTYANDPKAFHDAYNEIMAEKAGTKPDTREFG